MPIKSYTSEMSLITPPAGGKDEIPSDAVDLTTIALSLYVGGTGNVRITTADGSIVNYKNVPAGYILPPQVKKIWATGTTATDFVSNY